MALFFPFYLLLAFLILFFLGKPVIFSQERGGYLGKSFKIYKFRTMTDAKDSHGNLLPDAKRLTAFGNFIRKTSLDELPNLFNVIKGDMSLVGPRPLLAQYLPLYSTEERCRHKVLPGITGWAQINGRNAITWQEKFKFDIWYVEHVSFVLDIKILWLTLYKVLRGVDINEKGEATVSHFIGSDDRPNQGD